MHECIRTLCKFMWFLSGRRYDHIVDRSMSDLIFEQMNYNFCFKLDHICHAVKKLENIKERTVMELVREASEG